MKVLKKMRVFGNNLIKQDRMKKITLIILATFLSFAACQDLETIFVKENILSAVIAQDETTKTVMDGNNNILWSANDQIVAFMKSSYAHKYNLIPSYVGKAYADFEPASSGNSGNLSAGTEWDHNVVYYPYSSSIECLKSGSNYTLNVVLPYEQIYVPESFSNGSMPMVAVSEDNNIVFKNILGGMKLQLKGTATIASIRVEGRNNEKLAGAASVTAFTDDEVKPVITMSQTASTSVSLNCGLGVQLNESKAKEFIIALPPVLFEKGFIVTINDIDGNTYTISTDKANSVLRSSILIMPEVTLGKPTEDVLDGIIIDGNFSDWDSLSSISTTTCSIGTKWTALKTLKACADEKAVYVYFEFEDNQIVDRSLTPVRVILDADGSDKTGGNYDFLYKEATCEWLLEGYIFLEDAFCCYNSELFHYSGPTGGYEPEWDCVSNSHCTFGAGNGNKYELVIIKDLCPDIEWAETFGIGVEILQHWNTVGVLPNADCTDNNYSGSAPLLCVTHDSKLSNLNVKILELNYSSLNLHEGGTARLTARRYPYGSIEWTSDNPAVATIDQNGLVTAISEGSTIINATANGTTAICPITVGKANVIATKDYIDEYGVNHGKGVAVGGSVWAPVNCGYHKDDYQYGKLYQWGRKFGQGYDGDATIPGFSSGGVSLQSGQSENNKNLFFICPDNPCDWLYQQDEQLWNTGTEELPKKTEYDPCPDGWRVPTYTELNELTQNHSAWSNEKGQNGYWCSGPFLYSPDIPQFFLSAAGGRDYNDGHAYNRGSVGLYWSSRPDSIPYPWGGIKAYGVGLGEEHVYTFSDVRAFGFSVRCVQE